MRERAWWLFKSAFYRLMMQNSMCSGVPGYGMPVISAAAVGIDSDGLGGWLAT